MRKLSIKGKQTWIRKRLPPPNTHSVNSGKDASVSQTASMRTVMTFDFMAAGSNQRVEQTLKQHANHLEEACELRHFYGIV